MFDILMKMQDETINTNTNTPTLAGRVPRTFWAAKAGNANADYEDAFAVGQDCLAIADGATESSFARAWAQALTEGFAADPTATQPPGIRRLREWLRPLQSAWHAGVAWDRLPWYAEDKARSGAFATFLGFQMLGREGTADSLQEAEAAREIEAPPPMESSLAISFLGAAQSALGDNLIDIEAHEEGAFVAFAIGDSCLFQIRDNDLELTFPLAHSSQFDSRPILVCSNDINNKEVWDDIALERGTVESGDILLFATDALARWFLVQHETGEKPWETLCALQSQSQFDAFITGLRHSRAMRNDDVTLLILDGLPTGINDSEENAPSDANAADAGEGTGIVAAYTGSESHAEGAAANNRTNA